MEFEDLGEAVKWEAHRVAAAFGVQHWEAEATDVLQIEEGNAFTVRIFHGRKNHEVVYWHISEGGAWQYLPVTAEEESDGCHVCSPHSPSTGKWRCHPQLLFDHVMACALYRLGCDNETLLSQLPLLSSHGKLELRLSMPREFWLQKWLEEERGNY